MKRRGGCSGDFISCELALCLVGSASLGLAIEEGLAILVELELGDDDFGRVDADVDGGAIDLLAGDALDVDDPLAAVDLHHLALAALVCPADYLNLVVLADGDGADVVLVAEVGGEGCAHQHTADAGGGREVSLPALAPRARDARVVLHGCLMLAAAAAPPPPPPLLLSLK